MSKSQSRRLRAVIRATAIVSCCWAMGACSSSGTTDYSELFKYGMQQLGGSHGRDVTLQEAAAVPYATIGGRLGNGEQVLLPLATDEGGTRLWTSASRVALQTSHGRLISTAGLPKNLTWLALGRDTESGDIALALKHPVHEVFLADFADLKTYSVPISCVARRDGRQTITLLGQAIETVHVSESCESPQLAWDFTNQYWVDPTGAPVWRSVQHFHPGFEPIEIETLRPPE